MNNRRSIPDRLLAAVAFTLIEVLIGIVVLALGLVGLAAVFPTVVRQQQVASDQVAGLSSAHSAIAMIQGHAELRRPFTDARAMDDDNKSLSLTSNYQYRSGDLVGWSILTWDPSWSQECEWMVPTVVPNIGSAVAGSSMQSTSGDVVIGIQATQFTTLSNNQPDPRRIPRGGVVIPMRDRLIPAARPGLGSQNVAQPRYVWDMVVRRVDMGEPHFGPENVVQRRIDARFRDDGVQVAVFVRRVDPGIRLRSDRTLSDYLAPINAAPERVPVAMRADGTPSLDGEGEPGVLRYSQIQTVDFTFVDPGDGVRYDLIDLSASNALLPYASQLGQLLVDRFGNVHKIVEVLDGGAAGVQRVRLEGEMRRDTVQPPPPEVAPVNASQLLFTPQIPASVEVVTIPPAIPDPALSSGV